MMKRTMLFPVWMLAGLMIAPSVWAHCGVCGVGDSHDDHAQHAQVRVAHLSPDAPAVDIWVDGKRALENVPFKALSGYLNLPGGEHRIQVSPAGKSEPIVIDATVDFKSGKAYTVAATGSLEKGDLKPIVLNDDRMPALTQSKVRFVHASPDAPAVDIAVAGGPVVFSNVAFRKGSEYLTVDAGTYDLEVRPAGKAQAVLEVPGVTIKPGSVYTIFATGMAGDGTLAPLPAVDARVPEVRVAHLSPDAPAVDIWVDGKRALTDVPFKTVSDYLMLPAGEYHVQVSPAGKTEPIVIDARLPLELDHSYTVAATGSLQKGDLKPIVLVDDRMVSGDKAKVRFVHTSPDAPAVDIAAAGGPVVFSDIAFRKASDYQALDGGSYDLEVRPAGKTQAVLKVPGVRLQPGMNYTVFAIGMAGDGTLAPLPVIDASGH